jgi:hypothetical protein
VHARYKFVGHLKHNNSRSGLLSHHMQKQTEDKINISYLILQTHCTEHVRDRVQQFIVLSSASKLVMFWLIRELVKPLKEMPCLVCVMDLETSVSLPKASSSILFAHFPPAVSLPVHVGYTTADVYSLRHSVEKKMSRRLEREA